MTPSELARHKEALLAAIPADGTAMGNGALREKVQLSVADYQSVVDELIDDGSVERWRGRGGTLRRTAATIEAKAKTRAAAEEEKAEKDAGTRSRVLEAKLYPPFLASLRLWANDQGWTQRKRQFLPLLAAAEAGRETQAPETASLIHAQRIHPRPGVLA